MSHHRQKFAVMATLAALVVAPATASATSHDSAAAGVQVHITKAETAVKRLKRAVHNHKSSAAKHELKVARSQTAAAARSARSMARTASTDPQEIAASQSLALVGTQYDSLIATITALVDEISGQAQQLIAQAISPSIAGKQSIIDMLTGMLDKVPAEIQPVLASVITALGAGNATPVANLEEATTGGDLPSTISSLLTQCMNMAQQAIQSAFDTIQSILPMLPAVAQGPLSSILGMVSGTVGEIVPSVLPTITGLIDSVLGSLPFVTQTATAGLGMFGNLLGGLVGPATENVPGGIGSMISNLLGGLFGGGTTAAAGGGSTGPIAGIGGILNSVTGMINGLLGGLLGGLVPAT